MKLIVGMGNPGADYAHTRHNVGWMVLDTIHPDGWKAGSKFDAEFIKDGERIYLKPTTYMNKSGQAVRAAADYYGIDPADVTVLSDDLDLPFGEVRYRPEGGAGGHHGLEDIITHLGTKVFPRLRIGIGRGMSEATDHVLGRFSQAEEERLADIFKAAIAELEAHL